MRKQTTFLKVRDCNLLKVRGQKIFIPLFRQNLPITHLLNVLNLQNIAVVGTRKSAFSRFENVFFFYIRLYACLCANDIPKSCKFRFKIGQNSKCKLRFELVTYYLSRGTASSRALTRERQSISQTQLFFPSSLGWPAQKE